MVTEVTVVLVVVCVELVHVVAEPPQEIGEDIEALLPQRRVLGVGGDADEQPFCQPLRHIRAGRLRYVLHGGLEADGIHVAELGKRQEARGKGVMMGNNGEGS